jgi:hypothetical protein
MTEKSGPERYAPRDWRPPENLSNADQVTAKPFNGEVRELIQRDVSSLRRQRSEVDSANDPVTENLNALIQRAAGESMDEIDRVIRELESVREMLRNEGERLTRDVAGYASLNHAATTVLKVIADSIKQWKDAPDKAGPRPVS